jgi:predicted nucleotidyltransferase/uncharacterized protein with HEPN domain
MRLEPEVASRLKDVEDCCVAIRAHLMDVTFEQFVESRTIRSAVERELITIGEAIRALLRLMPAIESRVTDPRGIVDLRNVLVHGYRRLDPRTVWHWCKRRYLHSRLRCERSSFPLQSKITAMNALPPLITEHLEEVRALCEKYRVTRLTLFGSAVKGTFDEGTSDLDFVVEFEWHPDPLERGRRWTDLWEDLKDLFGRDIDLIVASTIRNPYIAAAITRDHVELYAA